MPVFLLIVFVTFGLALFVVKKLFATDQRRREYLFRQGAGPIYFEDGKVFLNVSFPQPVQAALVSEIDHVLFDYDLWAWERGTACSVYLTIVKKDGTATKPVSYANSASEHHPPEHLAHTLEASGIRCVMPEGQGSALRGNRAYTDKGPNRPPQGKA